MTPEVYAVLSEQILRAKFAKLSDEREQIKVATRELEAKLLYSSETAGGNSASRCSLCRSIIDGHGEHADGCPVLTLLNIIFAPYMGASDMGAPNMAVHIDGDGLLNIIFVAPDMAARIDDNGLPTRCGLRGGCVNAQGHGGAHVYSREAQEESRSTGLGPVFALGAAGIAGITGPLPQPSGSDPWEALTIDLARAVLRVVVESGGHVGSEDVVGTTRHVLAGRDRMRTALLQAAEEMETAVGETRCEARDRLLRAAKTACKAAGE